jgi:hypothetical protein
MRPRPGLPITISAVMARMSATAAASRTPVIRYGNAVGSTRYASRCRRVRPKLRAVSRATASTSATP